MIQELNWSKLKHIHVDHLIEQKIDKMHQCVQVERNPITSEARDIREDLGVDIMEFRQ